MFTSLKVVNIAVSFLAATKRSATFLRNIESFTLSVPRGPPVDVPIAGMAFAASSVVILPPFPVPTMSEGLMFFSSNIFLAAGDGAPVAYVFSATGTAFTSSFFTSGAFSTAGAVVAPFGLAAAVSIRQTICPTATASPSSALSVIIPLASAGNSNVALSESTSAIA